MPSSELSTDPRITPWSRRLLLAALLGIAALTLFPFHFNFSHMLRGHTSPFLLGPFNSEVSFLDCFLNVLLFLPLGFAIAYFSRLRNCSWPLTFALAFAGGAVGSYLVEFLQIFIPSRNSGWGDVVSNSVGAIAGVFVFRGWGEALLCVLSDSEKAIEALLTPLRVRLILICYLGLWFAVSIPLQLRTRLSNWDPNALFLVGGDAGGNRLWMGKVFSFQVWDQSMSERQARRLTTDGVPLGTNPHLLVSYDSAEDEKRLLPLLLSMPSRSPLTISPTLDLNGQSWFASREPVSDLVRRIREANQFSLRLVCMPAQIGGANGHVISIGDDPDLVDLSLRQEGAALYIWIRNPMWSIDGNPLGWAVPHVFVANQLVKILVTYDGSYGSVYVDGTGARPYRLSPGASMAQMLRRIDIMDLDGYIVVYNSLIFIPLGLLLGIEGRRVTKKGWIPLASGVVLPPVFYELLLVHLSGRGISLGQIVLCIALDLLGILLINADRRLHREGPAGDASCLTTR